MRKVLSISTVATVLFAAVLTSAADKVVVIPLNTTKISKQQTLVVDGFSAQPFAGGVIGTTNGCVTNYASATELNIPLTLPIGAKIKSASALIYDGTSNTYTIKLMKRTLNDFTSVSEELSSQDGGGLLIKIVNENLDPAVEEIVEDGESFYFTFYESGIGFGNGFCQGKITIELP